MVDVADDDKETEGCSKESSGLFVIVKPSFLFFLAQYIIKTCDRLLGVFFLDRMCRWREGLGEAVSDSLLKTTNLWLTHSCGDLSKIAEQHQIVYTEDAE
jgi:hypothetical protein